MSKGIYVGVGGVARKCKPYIGVGGVAKKVKKGYVGVGGVARLMFSAEMAKLATTLTLSQARIMVAGGNNDNYVLFAGGQEVIYRYYVNTVDAFNSNLVRSVSALEYYRGYSAFAKAGDKAVFSGGYGTTWYTGPTAEVGWNDSFDNSLVRTNPTGNGNGGFGQVGASNNGYGIFWGFQQGNNGYIWTYINAINSNNVYTNVTPSGVRPSIGTTMAAISSPNYAFFAGGTDASFGISSDVRVIDTSLVASYIANLSVYKLSPGGARNDSYFVVVGGSGDGAVKNTAEAYSMSLVKTACGPIPLAMQGITGVSTPDYALFAGGSDLGNGRFDNVFNYDRNLVLQVLPPLSITDHQLARGVVGGNALLTRGISGKEQNIIDIYQF